MRLWRRNVPNEPAPDADTIPPAGEQAEAPKPEDAAPAEPESKPEAQAEPEADTEEEAGPPPVLPPRTLFDRLMGVPVPEGMPAPAPEKPAEPVTRQARDWFGRLRAGLSRSSARLNEGIETIFARRRLDAEALEELEELLIASDMGTGVARDVVEGLRRSRFNQEVAPEEVKEALADEVLRLVEWVQKPLRIDPDKKPFAILVVGVNGSGKTTTIGKLAKQYREAGHSVVLAAGDTFRAAAVEQLQIWGERADCPVLTRPTGADAAGLAYDALVKAREDGADILMIDTAGRLQNRADLMGELRKIVRVMKKVDETAPHAVLLVLDATVGQNAHAQAEIFRDIVGVTGIVMTKLDGTAKGGVLVSLAEKYGIPIHLIGIGESADDLRPFDARAYARSLVGLEA